MSAGAARPTSDSAVWSAVAAEGTDAGLLQRVVAAACGRSGGPGRLLREATTRHGQHPVESPSGLLAGVVDDPDVHARVAAAEAAQLWAGLGVRVALPGDAGYPHRLANGWPGTGGPVWFAWRGPVAGVPDTPAVAVVGARRATSYGTGVAAWLSEAAGASGALVVSGGAVGIDAAAHAAALETRGGTAVMLGCGHTVEYPRPHAGADGLFARVLDVGGIVASELLPRARPTPGLVRARNRVVAGLSDVLVVVEGGDRSGSLITAGAAAELGVVVMAVPGDVRAPGSVAPHRLLAEGAAPCTSPSDLLDALGSGATAVTQPQLPGAGVATTLPAGVHAELSRRWPRPARVDDLAAACDVSAGALLAAVTRARVAGEIAESADGVRLTRAPR